MTLSGVVGVDLVVGVDSAAGAAGTLTLQDIGIHTCQFIMVVVL